jgi:acyl-CoA thioester hydrolase
VEEMPMFIYKRRVEFAETDAAGMAHFSVFFRYMEEAEHAVWRAAGLDIFENHEEQSWPRISAKFDFKAPLRFQDEFEVRTEMGAVTRSTIQWAHVLMRGDTVIGNGTVTTVCVKKNPDGTMKSAPIPEEIISRLRSVLSA